MTGPDKFQILIRLPKMDEPPEVVKENATLAEAQAFCRDHPKHPNGGYASFRTQPPDGTTQ